MATAEFRENLRTIQTKLSATADQELREFKERYLEWDAEVQARFRNAIAKAAEANNALYGLPALAMSIRVRSLMLVHDDGGGMSCNGFVSMPPHALLNAITAWDQGEEYTPSGMALFC